MKSENLGQIESEEDGETSQVLYSPPPKYYSSKSISNPSGTISLHTNFTRFVYFIEITMSFDFLKK